jgi:hypothetical protein
MEALMKFSPQEITLLNAICDIEVDKDGKRWYSLKPTAISDDGVTVVSVEDKFLSDPSISFDSNIPSISKTHIEYITGKGKTKVSPPIKEEYIESKSTVLFDMMIKDGVRVGTELPLEGIMYKVCAIDYTSKQIVVRNNGQMFNYFELFNKQ